MADIPAGWPCALLPVSPPSVADKLSAPTADEVLPQLLQLTPRGAAWGTDEADPGGGANPVMLQVWRAVAGHAAANYAVEFDLATQCFPSAITWSLPDWEAEFGLPDACVAGQGGADQRVAALRARFGAIGGQSPAYFVCLARSLGYAVTIEEPTQVLIDVSELGPDSVAETWFLIDDGELAPDSIINGVLQPEGDGDPLEGFGLTALDGDTAAALDEVSDETVWKYWIVHVQQLGDTWFLVDDGELAPDSILNGVLQPMGAGDPLEGFLTAQDLECELRRLCPPHTELVFAYDVAA